MKTDLERTAGAVGRIPTRWCLLRCSVGGGSAVRAGRRRVKKGQTLGIVEAMKLMNEIESEYDGVVEAVLVNNEDVVEYGQPLFRIR